MEGTKRIQRVAILAATVALPFLASSGRGEGISRELLWDEYRDKVAGGWLGQAIGVLHGQWTEGKWQGEIIPFDLEDWYRIAPEAEAKLRNIKDHKDRAALLGDKNNWVTWTPQSMSDQDDLYVEFMFLHSIRKYGLDVTGREMARDWLLYLDRNRIWCANRGAYENFVKGIWPPASGHPANTKWSVAIDFQIEADIFGLISPGLPQVSNRWGNTVGHMMNFGDGVYAGMAMSAMYGEAFFERDPVKLAEFSLRVIPMECRYAEMVRDLLALRRRSPDWQDAWKAIEPKYGRREGELVSGVDVVINGAYVYMGLLYGGGDFWKTMNISMRCGRDSDCNPSSSAGIIGTALGLKGIPAKWAILKDLPIENRSIREIYPSEVRWEDVIDATVEVGKWNVLMNGGTLEKGVLRIPIQPPLAAPFETAGE